jgi:hypothetical protein
MSEMSSKEERQTRRISENYKLYSIIRDVVFAAVWTGEIWLAPMTTTTSSRPAKTLPTIVASPEAGATIADTGETFIGTAGAGLVDAERFRNDPCRRHTSTSDPGIRRIC